MANLIAIDASLAVGYNASPSSLRWSTLLAADLGLTEVNTAVISTQLLDESSDDFDVTLNQFYRSVAVAASDVWAVIAAPNDMRYKGTDANNLEFYTRLLRSDAHWIARVPADKRQANHAGWTYTGSWTAGPTPMDAGSNGINSKYSSTNADKGSISISGTAITVALQGRGGLNDGAVAQIKIDGNVVGTIDTNFFVASGYGGGQARYGPQAVRYSGLAAGAHTVEIIHNSTTGKYLQIMYVAGNASQTNGPQVYLASALTYEPAGYAAFPPYNNGSDAAVALYDTATQLIVAELVADGHTARFVPLNNYFTHNNYDTDLIHPTNAGHLQIKTGFLDTYNAANTPSVTGTYGGSRHRLGNRINYSH